MWGLLLISIITVLSLISAVIWKPEIKIGKITIETFWLVSVAGAIFLFAFGYVSSNAILQGITDSGSINPLKILVIFISMTILSIVLDELGFFQKLAYIALEKAKANQMKIFFSLYLTVSLLTIFTSNDIIILTFTPFICYFAKNAKINPMPYLISEFVAANTWSMMLIIGNPTNIYLASAYNLDFISYFFKMALPTTLSAMGALGLLLFMFSKTLQKPIVVENYSFQLGHKKLVMIALLHLILCTILLTISSYMKWDMWLISLLFAVSILSVLFIYGRLNHSNTIFIRILKRAPWSLIPFLLSMFIIVLALTENGITETVANVINNFNPVFSYGLFSFLCANIMNNIPMTVFFSDILHFRLDAFLVPSLYAAIIGSNIGAYLTPIGALAGIMWMRILKKEGIRLSFIKFMAYGFALAIPTIIIALTVLVIIG